jgi:Recombination endonuclease VII
MKGQVVAVADPGKEKSCIDCEGSQRPAPYPGPRCFSHHQKKVKERKQRAHERHIQTTYRGMEQPGTYDRVWEHQGGRCPICGRIGRYAKKKFALEHDHRWNWPRGIVCPRCNETLAHLSDDPELARNLVKYLEHPPAWDILGPPPEMKEES